jgi:hypothetical protein
MWWSGPDRVPEFFITCLGLLWLVKGILSLLRLAGDWLRKLETAAALVILLVSSIRTLQGRAVWVDYLLLALFGIGCCIAIVRLRRKRLNP